MVYKQINYNKGYIIYNPNKWVISTDENTRIAEIRELFKALGVLKPTKSVILQKISEAIDE